MGEIFHKRGIEKKEKKKILKEICCNTVKEKLSEIANLSKTYSSDLYSTLDYVSFLLGQASNLD